MTRAVRIKEFTIDRSKWLCGELERRGLNEYSLLLGKEGGMCCLGFYARACGVPKAALHDNPSYECLPTNAASRLPSALVEIDYDDSNVSNTDLAHQLMTLNDQKNRTAGVRERMLKEKFKKSLGVTVKFVGAYPTPEEK